jgi:hypothetical protein
LLQERIAALLQEVPARETHKGVLTARTAMFFELATEELIEGRTSEARKHVENALQLDPGISVDWHASGKIHRHTLSRIIRETQLPSTLSWLAAFCAHNSDPTAARRLLKQYLVLAPDATDRDHVREDLSFPKYIKSLAYSARPAWHRAILDLKNAGVALRRSVRLRTRWRSLWLPK